MNLIEQYQSRQAAFFEKSLQLKQKYNRFAYVRLIAFLLAITVVILLWSTSWLLGLGFAILFIVGFYRFVQWHQRIREKEKHHLALTKVNSNELRCLQHEYQQFDDGSTFLDHQHPYAVDLDVFGPYSFFQYTNRTTTAIGRNCLATYLSNPAGKEEIEARQLAIKELSAKLDWRQHFQAYGMDAEDKPEHLEALKLWLEEENIMLENGLLKAALIIIPIWSLLFLVLIAPYYPWFFTLLCLLPAGWILGTTTKLVNVIHAHTTKAGKALAIYAQLIRWVEQESFQNEQLIRCRRVFQTEKGLASEQLAKLAYIINQLNVRYNPFAILLNLFGLWDLHWVYRLEKWKQENAPNLFEWFEALQEIEALNSLSTTYYNNPDWVFPAIGEDDILKAKELGHPLISSAKRVANDIELPLHGHIKLVTGSNMAGKSTFLRTVGLNTVLAMAGAPVCARAMTLPLIQVYTSMRTQDALHESTSSFYAELKRLKLIIEAVESKKDAPYQPVFLLDEILKGTNSNDRHAGGKALIKQLIAAKGSGIIATHDLDLGKLEEQYNGAVENLCMEVSIKDGALDFDYKLRKGVSQSFNATILMREMGIAVEDA